MTATNQEITLFTLLCRAVAGMDEEGAVRAAQEVLDAGIDPFRAIHEGLSKGMEIVGHKYETGEYFIPQLLICSDAVYAAMDVLKPALENHREVLPKTIVIGVVEGDTHDIGKNIVKLMLASAGFRMVDLGRDVSLPLFVETALRENADMICMSTLMSATMDGMGQVVELLESGGMRNRFKVVIGGGPVSEGYARKIGADGYARNAATAVKLIRSLLKTP